jgi:hypothetical protein
MDANVPPGKDEQHVMYCLVWLRQQVVYCLVWLRQQVMYCLVWLHQQRFVDTLLLLRP